MALFGKKTTTTQASPEPAAAPTDDFSPEALAALAESLDSNGTGAQSGSDLHVRKPVSFKNGSILGVNIGANSMKAVELTAKGGVCSVTGLAIAPTPPDSIANGVVMSVNVLADAVKELIAPFKSRKAVTSVAGTGEVIVRVIEVPTMTDAELQENMKTDLDRYIPFPPSEVQWDAAAMRDLPVDPSATNMDVLLVAARHELIELHLQLLNAVKIAPRAIDVEPLAAARALSGPLSENSTHIDYNDVCAVLNIGASSTEISILRGDELVFTRTVPIAGNMMTQTLMDQLNLTHTDAERLKIEKGDAAPPQEMSSDATATAPAPLSVAQVNANTDVVAGDDRPATEQTTPATGTENDTTDASPAAEDPFDLDLFNQGPTQSEPDEQHQQKMPDSSDNQDNDSSQLPSKKLPESNEPGVDDDDTSLPSKAGSSAPVDAEISSASKAIASFFDFDENELDENSEELPTIEGKPQHTEAPPQEEEPGSIDWDDDTFLPSVATNPPSDAPVPSAFAFPEPTATEPVSPAPISAPPIPATPDAAPATGFSLDALPVSEKIPAPKIEDKSTLPIAEEKTPTKTPIDDIDLSDILGETTQQAPTHEIDEGLGGTIAIDQDVNRGPGDALSGLGSGLEVEEKAHDELAVYALLKPLLDDLSGELRRSLEYHSARYPDAPVKRLILIGGGAKMRNIDTYFTQNLGMPTSIGNPFGNLTTDTSQVNSQLIEEHGSSFVIALGLAMREVIR